ncbi:GTP-binding protein ypt1 [Auriculariales sp. MPI-PUGE-AT-0066]|nr:GTP-binding protein ypt1 [Auriculariales sp. MPI-PUGE-AT-0066]
MTGITTKSTPPRYKVIIVGDQDVGKSSLLRQHVEGTFTDNTMATTACSYKSDTVTVDGKKVRLNIWDTAGQERFRKSLTTAYFRGAHAVIIVFGLNDAASFMNVEQWLQDITKHAPESVEKVLVGNKRDVESLEVRDENAQEFATEHGMPYFATSAKDSASVNAVFDAVARLLKDVPAPVAAGPSVNLQKRCQSQGAAAD